MSERAWMVLALVAALSLTVVIWAWIMLAELARVIALFVAIFGTGASLSY